MSDFILVQKRSRKNRIKSKSTKLIVCKEEVTVQDTDINVDYIVR